MRSHMIAALVLCGCSAGMLYAQKTGAGWKEYLGGLDSSHYSPLKQINASNVDKIQLGWTYPAPDATSVFCPLVVDTSPTSRQRVGRWLPSTRQPVKNCGCIHSAQAARV